MFSASSKGPMVLVLFVTHALAGSPPPAPPSGPSSAAASASSAAPSGSPATPGATSAQAGPPAEVHVDDATAVRTASSARLVNGGSSYSTGLLARRVMEQGTDWASSGSLTNAEIDPDATVAIPYTLADDSNVHILATELVESLTNANDVGQPLAMSGRLMEVDGVRYVVLTSYRVLPP